MNSLRQGRRCFVSASPACHSLQYRAITFGAAGRQGFEDDPYESSQSQGCTRCSGNEAITVLTVTMPLRSSRPRDAAGGKPARGRRVSRGDYGFSRAAAHTYHSKRRTQQHAVCMPQHVALQLPGVQIRRKQHRRAGALPRLRGRRRRLLHQRRHHLVRGPAALLRSSSTINAGQRPSRRALASMQSATGTGCRLSLGRSQARRQRNARQPSGQGANACTVMSLRWCGQV